MLENNADGVTADLDPPGPNPLEDMDPLSRIWTALKTSVLLSKIGKIVFGAVKETK